MFNKPLSVRTLIVAALFGAFAYVFIAGMANFKLIHDMLATDVTPQSLADAYRRADGAVAPWLTAIFAVCVIGGTCLGGYVDSSDLAGDYLFSSDCTHDSIWEIDDDAPRRWSYSHDDDFRINPSTGLPMLGGSNIDVSGQIWCGSD